MPPLSSARCFSPCFFASIAAASPDGPAPTITTSNNSLLKIISFCDDICCGSQLQPSTFLPFNHQCTRLCMDRHPPARPAVEYRSDCSSARTGSGCIRVADAALPKSNFDFSIVQDLDEFDVGPIRKCGVVFQQRADRFHKRIVNLIDE